MYFATILPRIVVHFGTSLFIGPLSHSNNARTLFSEVGGPAGFLPSTPSIRSGPRFCLADVLDGAGEDLWPDKGWTE